MPATRTAGATRQSPTPARRCLDATGAFCILLATPNGGSRMTVEQRLDQLEKRNKRLTVALTMTVVAMAAVVTTAPFLISCNST